MRYAPALMLLLLGSAFVNSAVGQTFMLRPMRIELAVKPGQQFRTPFEIVSTAGNSATTVHLRLGQLTQQPNGQWEVATVPKDGKLPADSALQWSEISTDTVTLQPGVSQEVFVNCNVPASANGFYGLIIEATALPPEEVEGSEVRLALRFLVPILLEVQGRPVRQRIATPGIQLYHRPEAQGRRATTLLLPQFSNEGRTYSVIKGRAQVYLQENGRWRRVAAVDVPERRIIPGATLQPTIDLERPLPSGKYKLELRGNVDGRRLPPLVREITFTGDPSVTDVRLQTALRLAQDVVLVEIIPGGVRTLTMTVHNDSLDPVDVVADCVIPKPLQGMAMGKLLGKDLSCAEWSRFLPEKVRIRGGGARKLRLLLRTPADAKYANYYGKLTFSAQYADGQSAGEAVATMVAKNKLVDAKPALVFSRKGIAEGDANLYLIQAQTVNVSTQHVTPECRAALLVGGNLVAKNVTMSGDAGMLLPLEFRSYAGELDLSDVDEGFYTLELSLLADGQALATEKMPIEVREEDGRKVVVLRDAATVAAKGDPKAKEAATGQAN